MKNNIKNYQNSTDSQNIEPVSNEKAQYLNWAIVSIVTIFPMVAMLARRMSDVCFYLLLLIGIYAIVSRKRIVGKSFNQFLVEYWPLHLAMASMTVAVLINQFATGVFIPRYYDLPIRLACFGIILWSLLLLSSKELRAVQWGLAVGVILCTLFLYVQTNAGTERPGEIGSVFLIPYVNTVLLMGFLVFISIGWNQGTDKKSILLKALILGIALYGSLISGTRGGWLFVPFFALILGFMFWKTNKKIFIISCLAIIVFISGFSIFSNKLQDRISVGISDISSYQDGSNPDTSLGIRLQLWEASWVIFKEHPFFGVGRQNYLNELQKLSSQNVMTPLAAEHGHSHNEILFRMSTWGIFGLIFILAVFIVPFFYFIRFLQQQDKESRTGAYMGITLCSGFFIYGLSDVTLDWKESVNFYVMITAILFAYLIKRKSELEAGKKQI